MSARGRDTPGIKTMPYISLSHTLSVLSPASDILNDSLNERSLCCAINVAEFTWIPEIGLSLLLNLIEPDDVVVTIDVICEDQARPSTTRMIINSGAIHCGITCVKKDRA